jgi:tetratricopeptide (TPR) repeat protein
MQYARRKTMTKLGLLFGPGGAASWRQSPAEQTMKAMTPVPSLALALAVLFGVAAGAAAQDDWLGVCRSDEGKVEERIAACSRVVGDKDRSAEERAEAHALLAQIHESNGEAERAVAELSAAIALSPGDASLFIHRGNLLAARGDVEGAIDDYNAAARLNPGDAAVYYNRGNAYEQSGRYREAIADYDKAIGIEPGYAEAFNNRGLAYHNLREFPAALADFERALALAPDDADIYYNRGNTYFEMRQLAKARADFRKALAIDPDHDEAKAALEELAKR